MEDNTTAAEPAVYAFAKNSREEVRATLGVYRGHRLADVRVYAAGEDDQPRPTRKGLALSVAQLPELQRAVEALIRAERAA